MNPPSVLPTRCRVQPVTVAGRGGRPARRWQVVCGGCGLVSQLWSVRRTATAFADRHSIEFCPNPGPVQVANVEPLTPEWHAARRGRIGGSEAAALLGLSPWESEFSLWHRKTGVLDTERDNDEMRAGRLLEPVIASWFATQHPDWDVNRNAGTWVHGARRWQLANPDGLITTERGELRILECKFALHDWQWRHGAGPGEPDEVPVYYDVQGQWYADVFGVKVVHFAVFHGASGRFAEYVRHADPDDQALLRDAGARFMARVEAGERPPIDGHDATYEAVKAMHPQIDDGPVTVPDDLAESFCRAKHAEKAAAVEAKRQTALLAEHMGAASQARWGGRVIARRQAKGTGVPYVVAAQGLPFGTDEKVLGASA